MAMPITRPGSISGEIRKVAIESRPGKRPRTRAMAQSVPSTRATAVEKAAIWIEVRSDGHRPRELASLSYQRNDQSGGGRLKTADEPNEAATVTTSGVIRKTTVKIAAIHMIARPSCSVSVMCCRSCASPEAPRQPGRAHDDADRYREQDHRRGRAELLVAHEQERAAGQRGQCLE